MSTATQHMEKTARGYGFNASDFSKFQKHIKDSTKKGVETYNRNASYTRDALDDTAKALKKSKKKMKRLSKETTKKSLVYGGGAGTAAGYTSANLSGEKNEEV